MLDIIDDDTALGSVGADAAQLGVGGSPFCFGKQYPVLTGKQCIGYIFPIATAKDERLAVLPHVLKNRFPLPSHFWSRPPMAVELHVSRRPISLQLSRRFLGAGRSHTPNGYDGDVPLRATNLNTVVAVDQRDVLDGIIPPLR